MALALDGSGHTGGASGTSATVTLSTSNAGDVIVVALGTNGDIATGVSSPNTTGWALRKRQSNGGSNYVEEWAGVAAAPLSSEVVTVTYNSSVLFATIDAFGVSGADTTTKWDANGALPDGQTTGLCSITTSTADAFLIGIYRIGSGTSTPGAGWTTINSSDFTHVQYKIVSATQSGLSVALGDGAGTQSAGIGDAIVIAGAGGGGKPDAYYRMMRG